MDVHKKTVVAAIIVPGKRGGLLKEVRTFGTMTSDLLTLSDWLMICEVSHVAMESTAEYWKPVFNILENIFKVLLVNAQHLKAVPGRKTEIKDSEWIADLLQHGLLRASFVPPLGQRELCDLTRARTTFVRTRATLVNRVHKVLESANIKLGSVASDMMGVSGRAMLKAIVEGQSSPVEMAELARGRTRDKRDSLANALEGRLQALHRFIFSEFLTLINSMDETIKRFNEQIELYCRPFDGAVSLLDTIPGVGHETAQGPGWHLAITKALANTVRSKPGKAIKYCVQL